MTRKYIYIHSEGNPSRVTSFFIVMLGDSHRDRVLKRQLGVMVQRYGDYFHIYDADTWDFVRKCVKSIFDSDDLVTIAQQVVKITPSALLAYLRGGDTPRNPIGFVRNAIKVQGDFSVDFRINHAMRGNVKKIK